MSPDRRRAVFYTLLAAMFLLHQDVWNWRDPRIVLGLPIGLGYHVAYCLVLAALFAAMTRFAWPAEPDAGPDELSQR